MLFLCGTILGLDLLLPDGRAIVIVFILVIIVAGAMRGPHLVLTAASLATAATVSGYVLRHGWSFDHAYASRRLFCIVAFGLTAWLVLRNQSILRQRRELATLLDLTGEAMFARDVQDRVTWWNRSAERLYGWSRREVLGRPASTLLGEDAATAPLGTWEGEARHRSRDDRLIDVLTRRTLRTDPAGRPIGVLEAVIDISRQKATMAELRYSEDRHRQIFKTSGAAVVEADLSELRQRLPVWRDGGAADPTNHLRKSLDVVGITDANDTALTLFGATDKDQLHAALRDILAAQAAALLSGLLALDDAQPSCDAETTVTTLHGETRTVLVSLTFPTAGSGHLVLCMIDVTGQRRTEAGLRLAQAELTMAARVATLGELTTSIVQGVDQPLAAIGGHARAGLDTVRDARSDIETVCTLLKQIASDGRQAAETIDRLRHFISRTAPATTAADLNAIVHASVALTRHELADQRITLQLELMPDLPTLEGDAARLEHVLVNLILNGIRSVTSTETGKRRLVIATEWLGAELVLRVHDSGSLCQSRRIDDLFEPAFATRPDGTRRDIGLAVCRSSVEAHRGRIWATQAEPGGTTIHVALPAAARS